MFKSICFFVFIVNFIGCSTTYRGTQYKPGGSYEANNKLKAAQYRRTQYKPSGSYRNNFKKRNDVYSYKNIPKKYYTPEHKDLLLDWPIKKAKLTQKFSAPENPSHQGIDLAGKRGTSILAAHSGYVVYRGRHFSGYGKMILIEYNKIWATLYAHLDDIFVEQGQTVKMGQTIGSMGQTGRATGVHLHFELIRDKRPIDPLVYLSRL